jgi:hypothetical protein
MFLNEDHKHMTIFPQLLCPQRLLNTYLHPDLANSQYSVVEALTHVQAKKTFAAPYARRHSSQGLSFASYLAVTLSIASVSTNGYYIGLRPVLSGKWYLYLVLA